LTAAASFAALIAALPARDADADKYADDGDNDHQFDQREAALVFLSCYYGVS
jgi:hypothetical protein